MSDIIARVASVRKATPLTRIVRLDLGGTAFSYRAGQVAMMAPEAAATLVPYSIASAPAETAAHGALEFLVKLDDDGTWGKGFAPLARGQTLQVRGPFGSFVLPDATGNAPLLFIAGGTGIAPVRSMLLDALARERAGRLRVLYSARTPRDFAYLQELRQMAREGTIEQLVLTATRETSPRWRGSSGRVGAADLARMAGDPATVCVVCGPASMVVDVPRSLAELGISRDRIKLDEW